MTEQEAAGLDDVGRHRPLAEQRVFEAGDGLPALLLVAVDAMRRSETVDQTRGEDAPHEAEPSGRPGGGQGGGHGWADSSVVAGDDA